MNKNKFVLQEMINEFRNAPSQIYPSKYWIELNKKNLKQLSKDGYRNFKRTVAFNYFTWIVNPTDPQIIFLLKKIPVIKTIAVFVHSIFYRKQSPMNIFQSWSYVFITRLLWLYVISLDKNQLLKNIEEPTIGNPPKVIMNKRLISQDLANSYLEYLSIFSPKIEKSKINTIIELGPGYGRTAYVILKILPYIRYIMVDIPPALYVGQRYLSDVFPSKKIFKFRKFKNFDDVRAEFEESDIIFLLPHQLDLIPSKYADLFINISSFHEMRQEQIDYYFEQLKRLTRHYVYLKEWNVSKIPFEEVIIRKEDYPIPSNWIKIYKRKCKVQTNFFEALFQISNKK